MAKTKAAEPEAPKRRQYKITVDAISDWVEESKAGKVNRDRLFYDDNKKAPPGFGVRVTKAGFVAFFLNYHANGAERRATVGRYPALSIGAARERASELRLSVNAGRDPLGDKRAARAAVTASKEEAKRKEAYSLSALLSAYVQYQKDSGKADWRKVEAAIARHITEPHPKLAHTPADEVTVDAVLPVFDPLTRDRKFTEARKLRAYLRAAYSAAKKARGAAGMHQFRGFAIQSNPLAEFELDRPSDSADKASAEAAERKWALSEKQLGAYWRRIKADASSVGAMLRFHLLTGGQRSEQLARLKTPDYDPDEKAITLYDTKGRRTKVHLHAVPLIPDAVAALETMRGDHGPYLFTTRGGIAPATGHNLWEAVVAVSDAMVQAGEIDRGFTPATIRKTVETRLATNGVPDEVLARLLSHGLGGVQAKHYNAHHYNPEKRDALNKLRQLCEPKGRATRTSSSRKAK